MTDTVARQPSTPGGPPVRGVASIAAALGLGAVTAAAACCVLPLALASLGVGAGLAGSFVGLASIRAPLLVLSAVALVVGRTFAASQPGKDVSIQELGENATD